MERNFPMSARQVTTGCVYLPQDNVHEYLVEGLKKSIMVQATDWNANGHGCICQVQWYLSRIYGGPPERFTQRRKFTDMYLIQLPPGVNRDDVVQNGREWCYESGWQMETWDISKDAHLQQKMFKVTVKITRFPAEFWHPFFVKMVLAEFGEAIEINEKNMWGEDRREITTTITNIDPRRIPYSSLLSYGEVWKECYFEITAWEYLTDVQAEARYVPADYEEARSSLIAAHDKLIRFQGQRSPPPSSSSSNSESHNGSPANANSPSQDQEEPDAPGLGRKGGEHSTKSWGAEDDSNRKSWGALSKPSTKLAVKVGDIPIFCKDLVISTLFVGTHAVSTHVHTSTY